MIAMQSAEFRDQIQFTDQELADIAAFAHDAAEQQRALRERHPGRDQEPHGRRHGFAAGPRLSAATVHLERMCPMVGRAGACCADVMRQLEQAKEASPRTTGGPVVSSSGTTQPAQPSVAAPP